MKTIILIALIASLTACNRGPQVDVTSVTTTTKIEVIYQGFSFTVSRVWINGLPYLVNSNGGIILEASEAEYAALVDGVKEQER